MTAENQINLTFTLTPEELKEGLISSKGLRFVWWRMFRRIFSWGLLLVILASWVFFSRPSSQYMWTPASPPPAPVPREIDDLWLTLLPSLIPALLLALIYIATTVRTSLVTTPSARNARSTASKIFTWAFGLASMLLVAGGVDVLMSPQWAMPWSPDRPKIVLVALLPWIALAILNAILIPLRLRQTVRNSLKIRPSLLRSTTLQIDAKGILRATEMYSCGYHWPYCISYSETENLLRVHLEDKQVIMIPKRSGSETEMRDLRAALTEHIPNGAFLHARGKFEVVVPRPVVEIRDDAPDGPASKT